MQILAEHSVTCTMPMYHERESPSVYGPDSRARLAHEDILRRVIMAHGTEHAAFVLIGEAAVLFDFNRATITPTIEQMLRDRARRSILELQDFCRDQFDGKIRTDSILKELERPRGDLADVKELLLEAQKPLIVLLVLADPTYTMATSAGQQPQPIGSYLQLSREQQILDDALRLAKHRDKFKLEVISNANTDDFALRVKEIDPTIIHFSGHGDREGVYFSTIDGTVKPVSNRYLKRIFERASAQKLRSVVMNCCYSAEAFQSGFAGQGAIVMEGIIYSSTAIKFTRQLYNFIGAGYSFEEAFDDAMLAIDDNEGDHLNAQLLPSNQA